LRNVFVSVSPFIELVAALPHVYRLASRLKPSSTLHLNSSRTVYESVPMGRSAAVASDWMEPRSHSTRPTYASSGMWLKTFLWSPSPSDAIQSGERGGTDGEGGGTDGDGGTLGGTGSDGG